MKGYETTLKDAAAASTGLSENAVATVADENRQYDQLALALQLRAALDEAEVTYCHWKSNHALSQAINGDSDLDLLIRRTDAATFAQVLHGLDFKLALAPVKRAMPGVLDYFGLDSESGKLLHVHAHYQIVFGDDRTQNYRLPIEELFFGSMRGKAGFPVPLPEIEFIVFVIRKVLKRCCWDAILTGKGNMSSRERACLNHLERRVDSARVKDLLEQHLVFLNHELFRECQKALRPNSPYTARIKVARRLRLALAAHMRRRHAIDMTLKYWRRTAQAIQRRMGCTPRSRIAAGGQMIAFVGGDGAGKTTAIRHVYQWLSRDFDVHLFHMGKPKWSWTTRFVRPILKIGRVFGVYPYVAATDLLYANTQQATGVRGSTAAMIREVCTARDRYLTYVRARRLANNGCIVLCDRFPLDEIQLMDGPILSQLSKGGATGFHKFLSKLEQSFYDRIVRPEQLFVLRLQPEIAVQRKPAEDPNFVRIRSNEIWQLESEDNDAIVVDASQGPDAVLAQLKARIWSSL